MTSVVCATRTLRKMFNEDLVLNGSSVHVHVGCMKTVFLIVLLTAMAKRGCAPIVLVNSTLFLFLDFLFELLFQQHAAGAWFAH